MSWPYEPLGPNQIRLLMPVKKSSGDPTFNLQHVSVSSRPKYAALSYVWGPPGDTHNVKVNGRPFQVGKNLYDALKELWTSNFISGPLWIDAICINQGADPAALRERSVQLSLMKQIYENASRVLVWLGPPENEECNRLAFQKMGYFEKRFDKTVIKGRPYRPWWYPTKPRTSGCDIADFVGGLNPTEDKKLFDVPGSPTHKAWLGIASLLRRPWWTRTWVLQEATVPEQWKTYYIGGVTTYRLPSKVRFICGSQQTTWNAISTTYLVAASVTSAPNIDSVFLHGVAQNLVPFRDFRANRVLFKQPSFTELLQAFRYTSCSDPRDKIYAPLCLATETDVSTYIQPDYEKKTAFDVYTDVVRYYLSQCGHELDFLGFAKYTEGAQEVTIPQGFTSVIPSWVPNFSVRLNSFPIPKCLHVLPEPTGRQLSAFRNPIKELDRPTAAAFNPLPNMNSRSFIEGDKFGVSGVYVDSLTDIITLGPVNAAGAANAERSVLQWAQETNFIYHHTGEGFDDACNRTLVLDVAYDALARAAARGHKYDAEFLKKQRHELSLSEYRRQIDMNVAGDKASRSRCLALSRKLYVSLVPDVAKIGDQIWALSGGQALYILRQVESRGQQNHRLYIGECYTHGLMDGEILQMIKAGKARTQDIFLV